MTDPVVIGAAIIGVAELIKLGNIGLQLYFQAMSMAQMTEEQINEAFQKALVEYRALPEPKDIPDPI